MKIIHLLSSDRFSGAENVACQIISMCREDGIDSIYCSVNGNIKSALEERNIKYNLMRKLSLSEIKRVIKEEKPDIIHAHDMRASFYAALCCGSIPLISHIHNNNFNSRKLSLKSILYYLAGLKAKHIFWVSESSFEGYKFHKSLKNKSTILYNIIDIEKLKNNVLKDTREYEYDIIFLGRLSTPKNPHRLLRVFEKIAYLRPMTRFAIVGTGELEGEIKKSIRLNKMLSKVDFLGFNANPYKILASSKVMIMTSLWEGTPMCALEALALGVPIVSTPTDGIKDLVIHGKNGYLSENDDELAQFCVDILDSRQLRDKISKYNSMISVDVNNKNEYKNNIENIYRSVL